MKLFSKILEQSFWQVLGKGVTSLSTFIILGLVARNYGQEGTGIFTLALTYLAIFYLLADFGFNAHLLKDARFEWQKLLGARILWSVILVILAIGLLPFLPFATPSFSQSIYFGSLAIIGSGIFVTCNLIFQSKLRYDLSVLALSIGTLTGLGVFALLIIQKLTVPLLLIGHLSGWIIIAATALFLVRKKIFPVFDFNYALKLFKDSWPIAATLALNVLYFRADAFIIAYFRPISDVGIYNVAYSVFQSALVFPTFIMNSYYPMMLKSLGGIKRVGLGLVGLALLGTLITLLFAPLIIRILTGGGFNGSVNSLQILSLGFPAYFLSSLLMWLLIAKNKYKLMLFVYMSGLIFNLILNLIFIPQYSYIAASWVTVISEYLILAMQVMLIWGRR
ncbi:flippase [Candidatus Daviesbacteria bacterium]|nr:flippase [Candidatus Daviesbacteria bacterium]